MPRLSYPADWENFAAYFARARRTSNLSAAGIAKRLEDDGSVQQFELQSLVPLGGHASHARVRKMEVCDCGGLWIHTSFGWHQAGDFEIRNHLPLPPHKLRFELILPLADGDDEESKAPEVAAAPLPWWIRKIEFAIAHGDIKFMGPFNTISDACAFVEMALERLGQKATLDPKTIERGIRKHRPHWLKA